MRIEDSLPIHPARATTCRHGGLISSTFSLPLAATLLLQVGAVEAEAEQLVWRQHR